MREKGTGPICADERPASRYRLRAVPANWTCPLFPRGGRREEGSRGVKSCDLSAGAAKLELALKSVRTTVAAVESQWNDQAQRKFRENHLAAVEPKVRTMFEAIGRMAEVLAAAERECGNEGES